MCLSDITVTKISHSAKWRRKSNGSVLPHVLEEKLWGINGTGIVGWIPFL